MRSCGARWETGLLKYVSDSIEAKEFSHGSKTTDKKRDEILISIISVKKNQKKKSIKRFFCTWFFAETRKKPCIIPFHSSGENCLEKKYNNIVISLEKAPTSILQNMYL